jgi:hypothetical protein
MEALIVRVAEPLVTKHLSVIFIWVIMGSIHLFIRDI